MDIVLGFDPGGKGNFGWGICTIDGGQMGCLKTGLASDAQETIEQVLSSLPPDARVLAAGIDAPLFWNLSGARVVDGIVREALRKSRHPHPSGTVQQINSLRGACLVQGVLLSAGLHREFPKAGITEAHPGALRWLQGNSLPPEPRGVSDHERDAWLAAFTAWSMLRQTLGWRDLYAMESNPVLPLGTPVSYWMPL